MLRTWKYESQATREGLLWNIYFSNKEELQMWFKKELGTERGILWQENTTAVIWVSYALQNVKKKALQNTQGRPTPSQIERGQLVFMS